MWGGGGRGTATMRGVCVCVWGGGREGGRVCGGVEVWRGSATMRGVVCGGGGEEGVREDARVEVMLI